MSTFVARNTPSSEHHGRGFRVRGDSSEYDSSEFSVDDIDDFEDEFAGNSLKTEGHAGRRKVLKRLRAGETKRDDGPRAKKCMTKMMNMTTTT